MLIVFQIPSGSSSDITQIISSKREALKNFKIGSKRSDILKLHKNESWLENQKKGEFIDVFYIAHKQFRFPLIAHFYQNNLSDYWITWPSYFLHDTLHKELVDIFGKQNIFFHKKDHSVYIWNNQEYLIRYEATCTITCFPLYLSVKTTKIVDKKYQSLVDQLKLNK